MIKVWMDSGEVEDAKVEPIAGQEVWFPEYNLLTDQELADLKQEYFQAGQLGQMDYHEQYEFQYGSVEDYEKSKVV